MLLNAVQSVSFQLRRVSRLVRLAIVRERHLVHIVAVWVLYGRDGARI